MSQIPLEKTPAGALPAKTGPVTAANSAALPPQVLYGAATFRRLLDSLARPGQLNRLDYPAFLGEPPLFETGGQSQPVNFYALGAFLTLLDREVRAGVVSEGEWLVPDAPVVRWLTLRSGVQLATAEQAEFVFFGQGHSAGWLSRLNQGTLIEPESSATVFYCVERLAETSGEAGELTLELSGPGIKDRTVVAVAGLAAEEVELIQASRRHYPLGLDLYLIDAGGRCLGLPRTTRIKITEGKKV